MLVVEWWRSFACPGSQAEGKRYHDWDGCIERITQTRFMAGCPRGVINRKAQSEHFSSAFYDESRRSPASAGCTRRSRPPLPRPPVLTSILASGPASDAATTAFLFDARTRRSAIPLRITTPPRKTLDCPAPVVGTQ